ncbi:MAG: aldehyde dehydrogenase EutE [Deltaproteobacteria bacterium]|nr:aldehyde dehydrogenase EutE [Deltaproteobacteria bacterium]
MSQYDETRVRQIVEAVVSRLVADGTLGSNVGPSAGSLPVVEGTATIAAGAAGAHRSPTFLEDRFALAESPASPNYVIGRSIKPPPAILRGRKGIFEDIDSAVAAAHAAYEELHWMTSLETRDRMIAAMRDVTRRHIPELSRRAVDETGLGRYEDKIKKNTLVVEKTPGTEILRPEAYSGDDGLTIIERAPYGVIGAITPSTNPTETILCNAIGMIAGGNAVVFNVHPGAKATSRFHVELLNEAIVSAGGPDNLIAMVGTPTIESAQALMTHPGIRLVVVTGGGAVVKAAMQSGKRAICAGPGNPPCLVDETANIDHAARNLMAGASIDNNIVCISEKETLIVDEVFDAFKARLIDLGCVEVKGAQLAKMEKLIVTPDNHINRDFIGKDAKVLLEGIGVKVSGDPRLVIAEVDEAHPFVQHEQLMPLHPLVRVPNVEAGIEMAVRVEHGYGHTATMYSRNIDAMSKMARAVNTSIFVKNAPCLAGMGYGGEGFTSFTIASPTGEGLTTARSFTRERRCVLKEHFRIV